MEYVLLDSDEKIERQCTLWSDRDLLSVDFEGEFNLHVYGEHLCLIQIYDGNQFFIIDPRSKSVSKSGLECFFSLDAHKLWFDCQSDSALVYKNYGLKIKNIIDLRVYAKALGFQGNLLALEKEYLGVEVKINKKKNQQANWMRRPLDEENISYALLDVAYLMDLKPVLEKAVEDRKLVKQCQKAMRNATDVKTPEPGWKRVGPWRLYSDNQKILIKYLFLARDSIAKRFNVPASRVLEKEKMVELVMHHLDGRGVERILEGSNPRFRSFLVSSIPEAYKRASEEIARQRK